MKSRTTRLWSTFAVLSLLTAGACGDDNGGTTPTTDVTVDADADAGEVGEDVTPDVPPDVPEDIAPDVPEDVTPDVPDVAPDVPEDVPEDVTDVEDDLPDVLPDVDDDLPDVEDDLPDVSPDVADDTADVPGEVIDTTCEAVDDPCTPGATPSEDFVCVLDGAGGGVCRLACSVFGEPCPGDEECLTGDAFAGFCGPATCSGFLSGDCGPGAHCIAFEDADDGVCVPSGPGAAGAFCDEPGDCVVGTLCFLGQCRTIDCTTDGTTLTCEGGAQCQPLAFGDEALDVGVCVVGCVPFAEDDGCPDGSWCAPDPQQAGLGACVPFSEDNAGAGEACGPGECCVGKVTPGCEGDPALEACVCALDDYCCDTEWDDVCADLAATACGACAPTLEATCGAGLTCVGGLCAPLCDLTDAQACPAGQACFAAAADQQLLAFGVCGPGCVPFTSDPTCGEDEACVPLGIGGGRCAPVDPANAPLGEACGDIDDTLSCCDPLAPCEQPEIVACVCPLDDFCCDDWDDLCAEVAVAFCGLGCSAPDDTCAAELVCDEGTCEQGCDPDAAAGEAGACDAAEDVCRRLVFQAEPLELGVCTEACDLDGAGTCAAEGTFCAVGEVFEAPSDVCLDVPEAVAGFPLDAGDACPGGVDDGTFCGPDRVCVDGDCLVLCFAVNGPLDDIDHPDCPDPAQECASVSDRLGLCIDLP